MFPNRIVLRTPPKAIPLSSMQGAGHFSGVFSGAIGYVRKHHIKNAAVSVELLNGIILHSVAVPSTEWIDASEDTATGGIDLPPLNSLVFVFFPYGEDNVTGAMILFSIFDSLDKKHQAFLNEGDEAKAVKIRAGGIKTTYDRENKVFTVEDTEDSKLVIKLDKANKTLIVTDWNDNKITADSNGMKLEGKGNTVELKSSKVSINGHLEVSQ